MNIKRHKNDDGVWRTSFVTRLVKNPVYIGTMVGLKTKKVSYKLKKKVNNRKEDMHIVENTHMPIIDIETFDKANLLSGKRNHIKKRKHSHPLQGLVYCSECGGSMTIKYRSKPTKSGGLCEMFLYTCSKSNNIGHLCNNKKCTSGRKLYDLVSRQLKQECSNIVFSDDEMQNVYKKIQQERDKNRNTIEKQILSIETKVSDTERQIDEIYQDKLEKRINVDDFSRLYENIQANKEKYLKQILKLKRELETENKEVCKIKIDELKSLADKFLSMAEPNNDILSKIIKRISIDKTKAIKIEYLFSA